MSIEALAWAKRQRCGDASAKLVLLILADYANHQGQAWPSLATITEQTELHRATVIRKLEVLEEKGLVQREHREKDTGAQTSNLYTLVGVAPCDGVVAQCDGGSRTLRPKQSLNDHRTNPPRRVGLADDWQPADRERDASAYPHLNIDLEVTGFQSHHHQKGTTTHDWERLWQGWLAGSEKYRLRDRGAQRSTARPSRAQQISAENNRRADAALARIAALSKDGSGGD